jgi:hypothetical protein
MLPYGFVSGPLAMSRHAPDDRRGRHLSVLDAAFMRLPR